MPRILHSGTRNASSWSMRAWLALVEAGIDFEERIVDLRVPQRYDNLAAILRFSPPGAVPTLVDGDAVIYDSLAIMEYANDLSEGSLLPRQPVARARARALLAWQHAGLSGICGELSFESAFFPNPRGMTESELAQSSRLFDVWEAELGRSGGPYLAGALSLPDLAFVPTIIRLLAHAPGLGGWPAVQAWTDRLLARASVDKWMQEARLLPPVYPPVENGPIA